MIFASSVLLGALAGLHAATWGAYKDSPFEGFRIHSYLRTMVVAVAASLCFALLSQLSHVARPVVVVTLGVVYTLERLTTEWWKTILRDDDQSAYTIPMRLGMRGRPVDHKGARYSVGAMVIVVIAGASAVVAWLQSTFPQAPAWLVVTTVGAAGGWATAVGGAWKDAPIEGFSGWKFLRSPVVATAWAVPLSLLTDSWFVLLLASGGFAVASIETYKTFLTGGRPPGKFAGRPVRHHQPELRRLLGRVHAMLWGALGITLIASLPEPARGVSASAVATIASQLPNLLLTAVAACAGLFAIVVLDRNAHLTTVGATIVKPRWI